jgi:hypothetical protein
MSERGEFEMSADTTHRADHQGGECPGALAAGRGGLADPPLEGARRGAAAGVGPADRGAPRESHRRRGGSPSPGGDSLRDVAGWGPV